MKRLLPIIALLLFVCATREAEKPDMEQIRSEVSNPQSPYYYPKLMARYEQNETIMTADDYRYLYLGAIYEEDFNPYRNSDLDAIVQELYFKSKHQKSECEKIIDYALKALADNPFDLQQIDYLIYAYREKKKNNIANIWQYRLNHLLEAIVNTGTGLDTDNAWFVISPQHEYFLLNRMGRTATEFEYVEPGIDHITVAPKGAKDPTEYYFNSTHFLNQYRLKFPTPPNEDETEEAEEL